MSALHNPRVNDNPSTYFVQDRRDRQELTRLAIQDQMLTAGMGGALPEQANPATIGRVLDVACGTGNWIIEAAKTYPTMSLVGIDISQHMIEHAQTQAVAHQVNGRVEFHVMDTLRRLDFPAASFDLVNLRFGVSFLRTWDWPKVLSELLRVTRPHGVIRLTEPGLMPPSNSSALTHLFEMLQCTFFRAGHLFTEELSELVDHLPLLLKHYGCQQVQTKVHTIQYRAGMPEREAYSEVLKLMFRTIRPFIQKWGGGTNKDYDALYQQALKEMQQPDFHVSWNLVTTWENKPSRGHRAMADSSPLTD